MLCLFFPQMMRADMPQFVNVDIQDASAVSAVAQDKYGMMWLATERGLYSYDGYRAVARFAQGESQDVRVYSLCIDNDLIYLGTDNGIQIYDIRLGRYLAPPKRDLTEVRALTLWHGDVWIGSAEGLFRMKTASLDISPVGKNLHNVYSLLVKHNQLLVGTIGGLTVVGSNGKMQSVTMPDNRKTLVNALCDDAKHHCVWVGTEGAMYAFDGKRLAAVTALQGNSVKSFSVDGAVVYVGTDNGLYTYSPMTHIVCHATHDSRESRSIANNIVWSLFSDSWGNLWAGTDKGLSMLLNGRLNRKVPLADITGSGDGNALYAIFRHTDGTIWMGGSNGLIAYEGNINKRDAAAQAAAWYRFNSPQFPLSHNRVRRIVNDSDGRLLVCTDHGVNIYDPLTRQFKNVIVTDATGRYTTSWAYDIVDDGQGRYWIASYMGGVFVIGKQKMLDAAGAVVADKHILDGLQGLHVWQLASDGKGHIWACLYDHGLDCIDIRTMKVRHVTSADTRVNYIVSDRKGNIWAAMDNVVRRFGKDARNDMTVGVAGLASGGVSMLAEVEGDIWAFRGRQCTVIRNDGSTDCFAVKSFTPIAMYYDKLTHSVILGGNDCILSLPASAARDSKAAHKLMLSSIEVDGKNFVPEDGSASFVSGITLSHRQNNLDFLFTDMPAQGMPPRLYAFMLEGADRTWQYMDATDMHINYNSLPPGHYKLHLRSAGGDLKGAKDVYTLDVRILPPWYLSIWMKTIYLLIVVVLLWLGVKFYLTHSRLKEERAAKERVLGESLSRQTFFENLSYEIKTPLSRIFASVLSMLHGETDAARNSSLEQMRRDVVDINRLVSECLDVQTASQTEKRAAAKVRVDIVDFWRRVASDGRYSHGKGVAVGFHTDVPSVYVETDVARMQAVAERLLEFAVEHAGNIQPTVNVTVEKDRTVVGVTVPGISVGETELPLIFNRYFTSMAHADNSEVHFEALAFAKEFADADGIGVSATADRKSLTVRLSFNTPMVKVKKDEDEKTVQAEPDSQDARLFAKIIAAVEEHIADSDFNVTSLQETLGLGSKLLYRKVKQMTGKTPVEFIRHIRMQHAAVLLREGKFSVSEVMYMVGYSNSSYFSKCFQKAYGISPADYSRKSSAR